MNNDDESVNPQDSLISLTQHIGVQSILVPLASSTGTTTSKSNTTDIGVQVIQTYLGTDAQQILTCLGASTDTQADTSTISKSNTTDIGDQLIPTSLGIGVKSITTSLSAFIQVGTTSKTTILSLTPSTQDVVLMPFKMLFQKKNS